MSVYERGYGIIEVLLGLAVLSLIAGSILFVANKSSEKQNAIVLRQPNNSATKSTVIESEQKIHENNNSSTAPTAPSNLTVRPSQGGYALNWTLSANSAATARYQVFYQDKVIAEPTSISYFHALPPPPPSCNAIPLTYYVKAIDSKGTQSEPSNKVTVQYGGC